MKITSCGFQCAIVRPEDSPKTPGPDVVFLGRSNVGKSSLINRLLGVKGLARTSSTPGRTQTVSFFRVNDSFHFVDLPGYGFAKVPAEIRRAWGPMIESVLEHRRERIAVAVLIVDARHGLMQLDETMRDWLEAMRIPYIATATKADKLSGNKLSKARKALQGIAGELARKPPFFVSSQTGMGIREVWRELDQALSEAVEQRKGR